MMYIYVPVALGLNMTYIRPSSSGVKHDVYICPSRPGVKHDIYTS